MSLQWVRVKPGEYFAWDFTGRSSAAAKTLFALVKLESEWQVTTKVTGISHLYPTLKLAKIAAANIHRRTP